MSVYQQYSSCFLFHLFQDGIERSNLNFGVCKLLPTRHLSSPQEAHSTKGLISNQSISSLQSITDVYEGGQEISFTVQPTSIPTDSSQFTRYTILLREVVFRGLVIAKKTPLLSTNSKTSLHIGGITFPE